MLLRELAHARAGDKGNISNIAVIAYDPKDYPLLEHYVTAERVKALRAAFDASMKDPELLADATKQRIDISPATGDAVASFIAGIYKTPQAVVQRAKKAIVYE